ncbi:hypothetical protein ACWEP8_26780 [Streptomyces hydrogenans]
MDVEECWRRQVEAAEPHQLGVALTLGLDATKAHLSANHAPAAAAALDRLRELEADGQFEGFSVAERSASYDRYYGD